MKLKYSLFAAVLAGGLSLAATFPVLANDIFLKIPGVTGPVTLTGYVGDIQLLAYSQGFQNTSTISSGGTTTGKTLCGAISFTKLIDSTSTIFLQDVMRGTHIPTVYLYFLGAPSAATSGTAPYSITLSTVIVTSISQSDSSNSSSNVGITESISLIAEKFQFSFRPVTATGGLGPPETVGWDCLTNAPF
jgi:type VI secretion system secreted protein Hcp